MSFFRRLFVKSPSDLLTKGDKYMESDCFFDARTCYEDGLQSCSDENGGDNLKTVFTDRIVAANGKLAERNLYEAESAYSRGDIVKAIDHLELVKTLTHDRALRNKAEKLLLDYIPPSRDDEPINRSSCASCSGGSGGESADSASTHESLPLLEYYELLIQQLPGDQYQRYAELGEAFAYAYIAASRDEHHEALSGFECCRDSLPQDIYWYEKGKVLHRIGNDTDSEQHFRKAIRLNNSNSLAWVNLALMLRENNRFDDALSIIEQMVAEQIMPEQALLLQADISEATGDYESAVNQYVELLQTPFARAAAEKLYMILQNIGRQGDAAVIFKKYLNKSCH